VRPEFVWAALDCPGGIVTDLFGELGRILLGRLTADLRRPVRAGEPHVVQAWTVSRDGRKLHTATALHTAAGELCAVARAVWIEVAE
jgi:acyl-CoA thioesterase FadM